MRLVVTGSYSPYLNLAYEEYFLRNSAEEIFMLWRNQPTVVIGKNQNIYNEVRTAEAEKKGICLVRRQTGGGAVYHDLGNINYSLILPRSVAEVLDFEYFTRSVRTILSSLGWQVCLSGRNDLVVRDPVSGTEAKISGSAQTATRERVLHHGTLLYDCDLAVLGRLLTPGEEKIRSHGVSSVRSRVVNLKTLLPEEEQTDTDGFLDRLLKAFSLYYSASWENAADVSDGRIVELYEKRNASPETIYGKEDRLEYSVRVPLPAGKAILRYRLNEGKIEKASFEGDFLGIYATEELEKALEGVPFEREEVEKVFSDYPIGLYLSGGDTGSLLDEWFPEKGKRE
ncbi:MAG: lipoate--protein ligase [Clostridia bacterium]|nr:lipoate--protein ligase [Clostridia bacterium]